MKPKIRAVAVAILYFLAQVFAVIVTENTVQITTVDITLGDLVVNAGVYYSIVDSALVTLVGTVNVRGGFYVTSAKDLTSSVVMTGGIFVNSGTVSFNSLSSKLLSTYGITTVGSFENTGDMYFGISRAPIVGTPFIVTSVSSWTNTGMMVFRSRFRDTIVGSSGLSTIKNDGSICLYNTFWAQTLNIDGTGCITVAKNSEMQLQLSVGSLVFSVAETQTIYLKSSISILSIIGLSASLAPGTIIKVAGFGDGNVIAVNLLFLSHSYSPTTGLLTLSLTPLLKIVFDIGTGYDSALFITAAVLIGKGISYSGRPPNNPPSTCSCTPQFPDYTTTYTTTKYDGSIVTDCGVLIVTTDSAGSLTTATSFALSGVVSHPDSKLLSERPSSFITSRTSTMITSCDQDGVCVAVPETTVSPTEVMGGSVGATYTTEVFVSETTVVDQFDSSVVSTMTFTLTMCVNCDSGAAASQYTSASSSAAGSGTINVPQASSISTLEGKAATKSMVLSLFIVPLLAFLL
ncbi:hypothetical protein METBIDRAFT_47683 [Metschnikowia bicuspidata var. bicuspidata NRRL YB-4993]|uniref:Hyphally-regulated cell wall protein N-terminal domain-containing protein n=1 Tax=Metschnikowia bicuspidata var. bicuspidata NRRL YB-4993 TaxID=869754 RepID=A0A1A0H1W6_9ASCO|nr:hypothetical protein METBIDRAFT_47683 [Metschnikowia bicuspidata var. bicuspidata NRRL YB-4993]OBA17945.1 hypothetical protein METBIDRAFT_47683 [Metschnikowia bicuspidata var. bicuspidata NRRL YB-4993]